MFHWSHNSFLSSKDKRGFRHTFSIDFCAFKKTEECLTYKCLARSNSRSWDPRDGTIVLAKFSANESCDTWTARQVEIAQFAQKIANQFNNKVSHMRRVTKHCIFHERKIEFQIPQTSELESVSIVDRRRKKGEKFIILDQLENSETFVCSTVKKRKNVKTLKKKCARLFSSEGNFLNGEDDKSRGRGRRTSESDVGNVQGSHLPHQHLHAFVHHFFCQCNGTMAIDHLQGEYEHGGYTLSIPVIHSMETQFGIHDNGSEGISRVIHNHVCTDLCRHLPQMSMDTNYNPTDMSMPCVASNNHSHCLSPTPVNVQYQQHYPEMLYLNAEGIFHPMDNNPIPCVSHQDNNLNSFHCHQHPQPQRRR